jgi:S1-C subfamily serine protease
MRRCQSFVAFTCATVLLGLGALAFASIDDPKEKAKPKDAATLDDQAGTLTVDGKESTKKIDLKYSLKVKGYFDKDGFNMEEVEADGPATHLRTEPTGDPTTSLEKGDIITEVDGKKVTSAEDYAKAINGAADQAKLKIKVKDVNTGNESDFFAEAAKR